MGLLMVLLLIGLASTVPSGVATRVLQQVGLPSVATV